MGDRLHYLEEAISMLGEMDGIELKKQSSFYETDPVGYTDQEPFLNCVIELETQLEPMQVLDHCMAVEQALKRKRIIRWGPRTIDVDILLFDDLTMNHARLIIPHPRMHERAFVLVPLIEIWENGNVKGKPLKSYLVNLGTEGIRKMMNEK